MFSGGQHNSGITGAHESVEFDQMRRQSVSVKEADRQNEVGQQSDAGTELRRENTGNTAINYDQVNRISTNKDLSALTNQVLELILDNVKMVHINHKLVEYFKDQSMKLEVSAEKTQATVQEALKGQNSTGTELSAEITNLKLELESEKNKKKELIKLVEHERGQFEKSMRENKYSSRKTNSELHEQIKSLKQSNIEKDM